MSNVLITPTLLDKLEFALNAPPTWKDRAYAGFVRAIRREKGTFPDWVKWGNEFEDEVVKWATKAHREGKTEVVAGSPYFNEIATACIGGEYQAVEKINFEIEGEPALLYCRLDVKFPHKIIDIKTTTNWKGRQKYLKGWQHKCYALATGISAFEYRVLQWESAEKQRAKAAFKVSYDVASDEPSWSALSNDLDQACLNLFSFLREENLFDDYFYTFSNNKKKGAST